MDIAMLNIKNSKISGQGVFAAQRIAKGEYIISLTGEPCTVDETPQICQSRGISNDDPLQIAEDVNLILNPTARTFNHSCSPNAGIRHSHYLHALKDIEINDEITYDYSSTVGKNDPWQMPCHCGASECRGKIGNVLTIPRPALHQYAALDLLPEFIKRQLNLATE